MRLKKLAKLAMVLFVGVPIFLSLPLAIIGLLQGSVKSSLVTASFLALIGAGTFTALRRDAKSAQSDAAADAVATDGGDDDAKPTPKEYFYSRVVRTERFWKAEAGLYSVGAVLYSIVYFVL
jgi:hypothetical protein